MACEFTWNAASDPEIQLRIRPLREQWEARGPGMLAFLARRFAWIVLPKRLVIELAKPGVGDGEDVVSSDSVRLEAYLANPLPQLPETVRLAWLCMRAAIPVSHQDAWFAAALIPSVIEAAEYVELASLDTVTVAVALQNWFHESPTLSGDQLLNWWRELDANPYKVKEAWLQAARKLDPLQS